MSLEVSLRILNPVFWLEIARKPQDFDRSYANWLSVRDDFRNWMVSAVQLGSAR